LANWIIVAVLLRGLYTAPLRLTARTECVSTKESSR
jgi:hypothetical protein